MVIQLPWVDFKSILDSNNIPFIVEENDISYSCYINNEAMVIKCYIEKDTDDSLEFETSYKSDSNKKLVLEQSPFASKILKDGKKLFARNHGEKFTLSSGPNTLEFSIPYPQVKFNELEIIGGEIGDILDLKILDDSSGTYTTVPNYQLNQFGFTVACAKDYYRRASNYDADLFYGMRVVINFTSSSAKDVYINYILHEVK